MKSDKQLTSSPHIIKLKRKTASLIYRLQRSIGVQKKNPFPEIIGVTLLEVIESQSTYIGLNNVGPTIVSRQIGFKFDIGYMAVDNPIKLELNGSVYTSSDLEIFTVLRSLTGSKVTRAWFEREVIVVVLGSGILKISLRDEDFRSPEAGTFALNDKSCFIVFSWED